ncbi:MAG: hypothetical protein LQ348_004098 [Seirophora lacunosa]|nr:MAG: hypothetical protein LQ348_004098 [Seirophora lacunosa]
MADQPAFDPFSQSFTLLSGDGMAINITIPELDAFILYSVQISINHAAQLGASLIILIVLLLLTKPDKRKTPILIINCTALVLNVLRSLLQCLYFTGPFSETYAYFSLDYSRVTRSDYASQVTITVLMWLLLLCVEASLLLQVRVVCVTLLDFYKHIIYALSTCIAGLALAFRLALSIENAKYILALESQFSLHWLASAANITTSVSICWFSLVFVIKLGLALNQRKKLNVGSFGPMQIIFIMGCQTLIIPGMDPSVYRRDALLTEPAIFSIIEYFVPLPSIDSNVLTLVIIFLPLSSLWASASVDNRRRHSPKPEVEGKLLNSNGTASTGPLIGEKFLNEPLTPSGTPTTRTSHSNPLSPANTLDKHVYTDLEAQQRA